MEYITLKEVCTINMGQSPDSSSYNGNEEGIPFFQGNADFGERYPVTRIWCNEPTKIAHAGDILISVRAPIGALNYAKETCCIGRGLAAITPNLEKVSSEFIFWLLKSKNAELNLMGTGSTFKAIGRKVLEETQVPNIGSQQQHEYTTKMITMLDKIGTELDDVKQGQQNDRIALFYSGMNLYLEARAVKDPDLRKYLVSQAMKGISDSHAQIMQQLQMDINYLMTGQYTKVKGKSYEDMQEHMISINKSYDVIYRAMMLKAAIYYEQEELEALMTCLSEYGRFIEKVIIPIASKLTELDASITTLKNGVWDQRAKSLATVNELKNQLEHNNTYLLEMSLSDDENSDHRNSEVTVKEVNYGGQES